jgi:hypothetical protein
MLRTALLSLAFTSSIGFAALAQQDAGKLDEQGSAVPQALPVFGQLVAFAVPAGFKIVTERTEGNRYIREWVPAGETVDRWTEMITVTGAKGLAGNMSVTPELLVTQIAAGFKHACPDTFSAKRMGAPQISGQQALIVVVGCGTVITSITPRSQAALVVVIKGAADYYTVQWAERGPASGQRLDLGDPKWAERLKRLSPIKVCPLLAGEGPPYPSCIDSN